jgi:hypothetical protein
LREIRGHAFNIDHTTGQSAEGNSMNIAEIEIQLADLVKEPFDPREFPLRLLECYNAPKATLTKLRTGTQNKGEQAGDVLWSRKLYFRRATDGQAAAILDALRQGKATKTQKPRFLLASGGHEVAAYDTKTDETLHCDYDKLNDRFDFFLPLAGVEKYEAVAENPAGRPRPSSNAFSTPSRRSISLLIAISTSPAMPTNPLFPSAVCA